VLVGALNGQVKKGEFPPLPIEIDRIDAPLFVTWHKFEDDLRGCIGTFSSEPIDKNLPRYALISAFQDTRFDPISKDELPHLKCAVSLLTNFEDGKDHQDWEVGKHGIQIEFADGKRTYHGTFLPEVALEQGWTKDDTLKHLVRKAGYTGSHKTVLTAIKLQRYQSSKVELSYKEYVTVKSSVKKV